MKIKWVRPQHFILWVHFIFWGAKPIKLTDRDSIIAKMHSCASLWWLPSTRNWGPLRHPHEDCYSYPWAPPFFCRIYSVQISWVLPFWGFSGFPSKMVKTNQRRKQDKTRSTQKKMPEPEVQQLQNVGPTVARWRVPDVIFFLYLSIVFCFGFPILPYALSFYWHFLLRPLHFIIFF